MSNDDNYESASSSNAIEALDLEEKSNLARTDLNDRNIRLFRELTAEEQPIVELPKDYPLGIKYLVRHEPRCVICGSPYRELVEHVYINNAKKPQSVVNFFEKHFNARLNWIQINTHMTMHCDLTQIATKGLQYYQGREDEIAEWFGREYYLTELALLTELDDIRGMDCSKNPELKIKRANMVERLTTRIRELKKERDAAALSSFNVFEILLGLHDQMTSEEDKRIIRDKLKALKEELQSQIS